jgi:hypothetical protein
MKKLQGRKNKKQKLKQEGLKWEKEMTIKPK